jgi:hypothetical protein
LPIRKIITILTDFMTVPVVVSALDKKSRPAFAKRLGSP